VNQKEGEQDEVDGMKKEAKGDAYRKYRK